MWEKDFADLSNSAGRQQGLITSAQAAKVGVAQSALAHLEEARLVKRLEWDVYQLQGSPVGPIHAYPYAAWLALSPDLFQWERPADPTADAVLSHESACAVHGIGSLPIPFVMFTVPEERMTPRATKITVSSLATEEIVSSHGLPVTSPHRTILDLIRSWVDHEDVGEALTDAVRLDLVDLRALYEDMTSLAEEYDFPAKGPEFADYFLAELETGPLSTRNLRAYAALRAADRVAEVRRGVARVLAELRGGQDPASGSEVEDDELSWQVAAEIVGRTGLDG